MTAVSDARFGAAAPASVDVLPVDLEVWVQPGLREDADQIRLAAEGNIVGTTAEVLYAHGHNVGALVDWRGVYVAADGREVQVLDPTSLLATVDALSSYGTAMAVTKEMPVPYLPARLGVKTGSDATLYVGGWGFVGRKEGVGDDVLKAIVIGVVVIGVVALIAAATKSDGVGKVLDGAGKAAGRTGRALGSAGRMALRTAARAGTAIIDIAKATAEVAGDVAVDVAVEVATEVAKAPPADAFGRDETHLNLVSGRPVWSQEPNAKESGASELYLEMTLVDNATGLVRWHAHQRFPANPKNPKAVARAVRSMLAALPHDFSARPTIAAPPAPRLPAEYAGPGSIAPSPAVAH